MMGAGVQDYGTIGVMPVRGVSDKTIQNYMSSFSHKTEYGSPGYYTVHLDTHRVSAELTVVGQWTGMHRYSYEGDGGRYVILDALHAVHKVSGAVWCLKHSVCADIHVPIHV